MSITIEGIDQWFIDLLSSDKCYIYGLYHDLEEEMEVNNEKNTNMY